MPHQLANVACRCLSRMRAASCGGINEKLAVTGDYIPRWAGGLPSDAPPRAGTKEYDEYMRERERKRLMPAAERGDEAKPNATSCRPCIADRRVGLLAGPQLLIHKHHGFATIRDHPIFQVISDCAGQDAAFDIAPLANQIVR